MKKLKLIVPGMCWLVGTAWAAGSAVEKFTAYNLDIRYTNSTAQYWSVNGAPSTTGSYFIQLLPDSTFLQTDGSGHITGSGRLVVTYNTGHVPFSVFFVDYTGKVSSSAAVPLSVTLNLKGSGYLADATGNPTTVLNNISMKFTGAPGIDPLNKAQTRIVGNLSGTIRGPTPVGNPISIPPIQAVMTGSASRFNFVQIQTDVVQNAKHLQVFSPGFVGNGAVSGNTYHFSIHGSGPNQSVSLAVKGFLGPYTNNVVTVTATNVITTPITFSAPVSAELKGKVQGQVVSGSATPSRTDANLITAP